MVHNWRHQGWNEPHQKSPFWHSTVTVFFSNQIWSWLTSCRRTYSSTAVEKWPEQLNSKNVSFFQNSTISQLTGKKSRHRPSSSLQICWWSMDNPVSVDIGCWLLTTDATLMVFSLTHWVLSPTHGWVLVHLLVDGDVEMKRISRSV